jgi:hypothetical protein
VDFSLHLCLHLTHQPQTWSSISRCIRAVGLPHTPLSFEHLDDRIRQACWFGPIWTLPNSSDRRAEHSICQRRAIALSGYTSHAYRIRANEAGIHHYLLKPTDLTCLKDLMAHEIVTTAVSSSLIGDVLRLGKELPRPKKRNLSGRRSHLCSVPIAKG